MEAAINAVSNARAQAAEAVAKAAKEEAAKEEEVRPKPPVRSKRRLQTESRKKLAQESKATAEEALASTRSRASRQSNVSFADGKTGSSDEEKNEKKTGGSRPNGNPMGTQCVPHPTPYSETKRGETGGANNIEETESYCRRQRQSKPQRQEEEQ